MKKKMLYLMNVDWNWIKQRPQFMAERLSKFCDLKVVYRYCYNRKNYQKRSYENIDVVPMYVLPRIDRYNALAWINRWIKKENIKKILKKNIPDIVYCTIPEQIHWITDTNAFVIYDCMDNYPAFYKGKKRDIIKADERKLCKRADLILCSSAKLVDILCLEYGEDIKEKVLIVRNGYDGNVMDVSDGVQEDVLFKLCYFGTIGEWFNTEYIERSLEEFNNIEYIIMGPISGGVLPEHPRVRYCGTVEHSELYNKTRDINCFIMPFKVNDIVSAVDPVKLYEYINFNKDILCVEYPEIKRFEPYVYFYSDYDEYKERINELMSKDRIKYTLEERMIFLNNNSWDSRVEQIISKLKNEGVL